MSYSLDMSPCHIDNTPDIVSDEIEGRRFRGCLRALHRHLSALPWYSLFLCGAGTDTFETVCFV